ncbi:MAG TPA: hypothetical protein VFG14_10585 [Chthoniobacteraceae bacterium]|nr:hypothetical protein [Chthoniobacteraceae bacterium]
MAHLSFFCFLVMQVSLFGFGLAAAALTCAVLLLPDRGDLARLLFFPALWLLPLALAGVFYEDEMKTADWIGYLVFPMLAAYFSFAAWVSTILPKRRVIAAACALINTPFVFLSAFVVGMASGGTWL